MYYRFLKRPLDILLSLFGIIVLAPVVVFISVAIVLDSRGGIYYTQNRVGRNNRDFKLFKFRTMHTGSDKKGLLTVGKRDARITRVGYYLRKYKLDELPQLFNVLLGDMSFVGPRPEVRKYVDLYNEEQQQVLQVRPGITDYASIRYFDENELLAKSSTPEQTYISEIMPHKLQFNIYYIRNISFVSDMKLIWATVFKVGTHHKK